MLGIYSLLDTKAKTYGGLQLCENDQVAVRSVKQVVNDPQGGMLSMHPEDFHLMQVGRWNAETGELEPMPPRQVVHLVHLQEEVDNVDPVNMFRQQMQVTAPEINPPITNGGAGSDDDVR